MFARVRTLFNGRGKKTALPLKDRFTEVYENRMWQSEESVSGKGSERTSGQVTHALDILHRFTQELGLRSIADVPCGDFNWMPAFLEQHPEVAYAGYDIVPALIEENRRRYPGRRFELLDITSQAPKRADLLFSKDLVNHLAERDVWAALGNMVRSKATYLMMTTNRGSKNVELLPGQAHASRLLDLEAAPYSMPPPLYGDHYLLLWPCDAVAKRLREVSAGS
jgi:hypothetical protein